MWKCEKEMIFEPVQQMSVIVLEEHMQRPATNQREPCHAMTVLGRSSGAVALILNVHSDVVSRRLYYRGCAWSKPYVEIERRLIKAGSLLAVLLVRQLQALLEIQLGHGR